jgi:hypothetical protein
MFRDAQAAADLLTFAGRAARIGTTAVRLQAGNGTLVMTTATLAPRTLLETTPTILALRILPVDPELACDLAVEPSTLTRSLDDDRAISLPQTALAPTWAGITPPRAGWEQTGVLAASVIASRAHWGIAAVADQVPQDAGEDAVRVVRAAVWGRPDEELDSLPLGAAFAAFALGFVAGDEPARVFAAGPWRRLTLERGHIVVRGPMAQGLTAVRRTGSS